MTPGPPSSAEAGRKPVAGRSASGALAEPAGQTSARWRVLATVEDGPSTVAQVARSWGLARQSVQRVADVLVKEGQAVESGALLILVE